MRNFFRNIRSYFFDFAILLFISLIPFLWFPKDHMVVSQDAAYPVNIIENFNSRLYAWSGTEPFGRDHSFEIGSIMIHGVEAFFAATGLDHFDSQKLTFAFWFFVMAMSMYVSASMLKKVFSYRFFPLTASILYVFNFYLLAQWRHGAGTTFSAYSAIPVLSMIYLSVIQGGMGIIAGSICIGLVLMVLNAGGGLSIPLYGGLLIIGAVATIYFPVTSPVNERLRIIGRIAGCIVMSGLAVFLLNAYWLLPFLSFAFINYHADVASQVVLSGARAWMDTVSINTSLMNLFRLQGFPDWYDNAAHAYAGAYLSNPLLILLSFLFAPTAFFSLRLTRESKTRKMLLFFVLVSLIGMFFSAGTHKPTGYIVGWMVDNIPGFSIFRSAQYKFVPAVYVAFSILISYSINHIAARLKSRSFPLSRYAIAVSILVIVAYHAPFFGRSFFVWNKPLTLMLRVPDHAYAFRDWSKKNLTYDTRLILLPRLHSTWNAEVYTWNYFATFSLVTMLTDKPIVANLPALERTEPYLVNRLYEEILATGSATLPKLTGLFQSPTALVRGDAQSSLVWVPSEPVSKFSEKLRQDASFVPVWNSGPWQVYRLPVDTRYGGRVYTLDSVTMFSGGKEFINGALLADANNAIVSTDVESAYFDGLRRNLPVGNHIEAYPCLSCVLDDQPVVPDAVSARILPGSKFYPLKLFREERALSAIRGEKEILGSLLGRSIIRLSELVNLIRLDREPQHIAATADVLSGYLDRMDDYFAAHMSDEPKDYVLYKRVRDYLTQIRNVSRTEYRNMGDAKSKRSVKAALGRLNENVDRIMEAVVRYVPGNDWSRVRYYSVSGTGKGILYMDQQDLGNIAQLPEAVVIRGTRRQIRPVVAGGRVVLGEFDLTDAKTLQVEFPPGVNLAARQERTTDNFSGWNQSCISAPIEKYSWNKKYMVKAVMTNGFKSNAQFFIRKIRTPNERMSNKDRQFSSPDVQFDLEIGGASSERKFYFSGNDGDLAAAAFFCVPRGNDPGALLTSLSIYEVTNPVLYSQTSSTNTLPAAKRDVPYARTEPTTYQLSSIDAEKPRVLVFNERFNPGWRLYRNDGGASKLPWKAEFWSDKPLYDQNHFRLFGYMNAWYLPEGSYDDIEIRYYPQQLFYRGAVITALSLLVAVLLMFRLAKRRKT